MSGPSFGEVSAEAAHRAVGRRTHLRIAALAALVVVVVAFPVWTFGGPSWTGLRAVSAPSTVGWQSPSAVPTAPAVSSTPSTSPTPPTAPGAASRQTLTEKAPAKSGCTSYGFASGDVRHSSTVSFTGGGLWGSKTYKLCPGETVRVWWVQYRWQPDGSQKLFGSGSGMVSSDQPSATLSWPNFHHDCLSYFVIGTGTASFTDSIGAGTRPDPLIRVWREGQGGATAHGFRNRTDPANC